MWFYLKKIILLKKQISFFPLLVLFLSSITWIGSNGSIGKRGYLFIAVYSVSYLSFIGVWRFWPYKKYAGAIIILISIVARILMLPFPANDDMNRYIWEGQIQNQGFNPYQISPDSEKLEHLRDANWEGINHKSVPAIYPPLTQKIFRYASKVSPYALSFKLIFVFSDILIILLLYLFSRHYLFKIKHVLLYALNPLVLLYVAGEGHFEPLYILFLLAAIFAYLKKKDGLAYLLLGISVLIKIVPVMFLPFFIKRKNINKIYLFILPFTLFIPYMFSDGSLLDVPIMFASRFYYNGMLFSILSCIVSNSMATTLCWIVFGVLWLWNGKAAQKQQ